MNSIKELHEDRRSLSIVQAKSISVTELVPILHPFSIDQMLKPFEGTIVRVGEQLGQGSDLWCAIPSIRTMDKNRKALHTKMISTSLGVDDQAIHVLEPVTSTQVPEESKVITTDVSTELGKTVTESMNVGKGKEHNIRTSVCFWNCKYLFLFV